MWLALAQALMDEKKDRMEQLLPRLEEIAEVLAAVERGLVASGVDGIEGAVALYRRLQAALDAIRPEQIARAVAEVEVIERAVAEIGRNLREIRRLKERLTP